MALPALVLTGASGFVGRMLILNHLEATGPGRLEAGFTTDEVYLFLRRLDDTILEWLAARGDQRGCTTGSPCPSSSAWTRCASSTRRAH